MKELIAKKLEEYRSEQGKLLAAAKNHEDMAQRARADAIAYGGAIQACEQIMAEAEKLNGPAVETPESTPAG